MTSEDDGPRWRQGLRPLKRTAFRNQFIAYSVSMIGSRLSPVALSTGIILKGMPVVDLGVVLAAYTVPLLVFVVVGGVVADKISRHLIMLTCDSTRAVTQTLVGVLLLLPHPPIVALVVLQFVTGTAAAFYQPASTGLTAGTVEQAELQSANALLSLARSLSGSVGPLFAATLVVTVGAGWALIIDGISYAGSVAFLSRIRMPPAAPRKSAKFIAEVKEGFREVRTRAWVWSSILTFGVTNLASSALLVLGPEKLIGHHGTGAFGWAGIIAAMSVGQVIGNLIALRPPTRRPMLVARLVELLQVPLLLTVAAGLPMYVMVAAGVLCGIGVSFPDVLWFATLQSRLPEHVISRVSSYDWLGTLSLQPVGLAGAAVVGSAVGAGPTLTVMAVCVFATCSLGALSAPIRRLEREPEPGPAPGSVEPAH